MVEFGGRLSYRATQSETDQPMRSILRCGMRLPGQTNRAKMTSSSTGLFVRMQYFAFEGIPAIYIHSLLATKNDIPVENTGNLRSINRHIWDQDELELNLEIESPTIARYW